MPGRSQRATPAPGLVEPIVDGQGDENGHHTNVKLTSVEINILIYLYLLESNFPHAAFTLLSESNLESTNLFQYFNPTASSSSSHPNGDPKTFVNGTASSNGAGSSKSKNKDSLFGHGADRIPRGELVRKLWKALRWEAIEQHLNSGEDCQNPLQLLVPHICPKSRNASPSASALFDAPGPSKKPEIFPPPEEEEEEQPKTADAGVNTVESSLKDTANEETENGSDSESPTKRSKRSANGDEPEPSKDRQRIKLNVKSSKSSKSRSRDDAESSDASSDVRVKRKTKSARTDNGLGDRQSPERGPERKGKNRAEDIKADSVNSPSVSVSEMMDIDEEPVTSKKDKSKKSKKRDKDTETDSPAKGSLKLEEPRSTIKLKVKSPGKNPKVVVDDGTELDEENISEFDQHKDAISCLAWNPRNKDVLATGSGDATARMWDFSPKDKEKDKGSKALVCRHPPTLISHKGIDSGKKTVRCLDWHPDGTVLATGSSDGIGRLFTPSGSLQGIMSYGRGTVNAIKFSPSGSRILVAKSDYTILLFEVTNNYNQPVRMCFDDHKEDVNDVDWLDDEIFASGSNDRQVFIFHIEEKRPRYRVGWPRRQAHSDDVTKVAWGPMINGQRTIASAGDDGTVAIWFMPSNPSAPSRKSPLKERRTRTASFEPKGGGGGGGSELEEEGSPVESEEAGTSLVEHKRVKVVTESENTRLSVLAWMAGSRDSGDTRFAAGGQDSSVKIYDGNTGDCLHVIPGLESGTGSLAFDPLLRDLIAVGGWDGKLLIFDMNSGKVVKQHEFKEDDNKRQARERPMMLQMSWRDDGNQLAVGMYNKTLMTVYVGDLVKTT